MQYNESIIIPVIIAAVELLKGLGVPVKFSALFAVLMGMVIGVIYLHPADIKLGIFEGVVYGLTASGLYSGAKNTMEQMRINKNGNGKGTNMKK